jgi:hypothetical protein
MSFANSLGEADQPAATKWQMRLLDTRRARRTSAGGEHLKVCRIVSGGRRTENRSRPLRRYAFGRMRRRSRRDAARAGSRDERLRVARCSSSSPATTTSKLSSGNSSGSVEVGPVGLDAEPGGRGERLPVGVEADDRVPVEVRPRQRAVAAAEIEHAPTRPADVALEQGRALGAGEHEARHRARCGCAWHSAR